MASAAYGTRPEVITALIKAGAKVDQATAEGVTALMCAAAYTSNPETVSALLKAGASKKLKDKAGFTAADYAKDNAAMAGTAALKELQK